MGGALDADFLLGIAAAPGSVHGISQCVVGGVSGLEGAREDHIFVSSTGIRLVGGGSAYEVGRATGVGPVGVRGNVH